MEKLLNLLVDITTCPHTITLCHELGSDCPGEEECKTSAHIKFDCLWDIGSLGHNEVFWAQKSSFLDDFWGLKSSQNEDI